MKKRNYIGTIGGVLAIIAVVALFPSFREKTAVSHQTVVTAIGIEKQEDTYRLSIQAVEALKTAGSLSEQSENATAVYRANGGSVAQALQAFLNETGRDTYILHNRIVVLGLEQCCETVLYEQLDYFIRNPEGFSPVDVLICRDDPSALLSLSSGSDAIPAEYVAQQLEEGTRAGVAFSSRMLDVQRAMSGMYDVVLPIVTVSDGIPRLDGTALFRDGRLVGELSTEQTTALLFAADRIDGCLFSQDGATVRIRRSGTRLHIDQTNGQMSYRFSIGATADIVETDVRLTDEQKDRLMASLSRQLERSVAETVAAVSALGCDPLALVRRTAKQYPDSPPQPLTAATVLADVTIRLIESGNLI